MDFKESIQSLRLLIIDDEESFGKALSEYFRRQGHTVDWCQSPKDAEQKLSLNEYDLIALDCMLPQKNGIDFAKEVYDRNPEKTKIVLMSGILNDAVFVEQAKQTPGVIEFLSKPFEFEQLNLLIKRELYDNMYFKGFDQFYSQPPTSDALKHVLSDTEYISGLDIPKLLSLAVRAELTGQIFLTNPQRETSNIHLFEGRIQRVETPDKNSFFGILLTENGFASMEEIAAGLSQTDDKPIGQKLFEMNSISPHAVQIVQCEQMSIRLSQLVQSVNYFIDYKPEETESRDKIAIDEDLFKNFLADWIPSKLSYKRLKRTFELFSDCSYKVVKDINSDETLNDFIYISKNYANHIPESGSFRELTEEHSQSTFNFHSLYYMFLQGYIQLIAPEEKIDHGSLLQRLEKLEQRFAVENHYEILSIETYAPTPVIEKAFITIAQSIHPDRIPREAEQKVHDLAKKVFQQLNTAKSVLTNEDSRKSYDFELQHGSTEDILKSEKLFEQGVIYIDRNNFKKAVETFKTLVQMKSFNQESYTYYAWAVLKATELVSSDEKKNKKATDFVQTLLLKVPQEIKHDYKYFYVRGLYYKRTQQIEKALKRFKQSYHLNPEFKPAAAEVSKIEKMENTQTDLFTKIKKIVGF